MPETLQGLASRAIKIAEGTQRNQEDIVETQKTQAETQRDLAKQLARSKWLWRLAVAGLVLDIALSIFTLRLYGEVHAGQIRACALGNSLRTGQLSVWHHVLAISQAPAHETAAERKARLERLAKFRVYVGHQYRPVDCAKLYGKG